MFKNEALTPVDGRYQNYTKDLIPYLSEAALNRERVFVELNWLIALSEVIEQIPSLNSDKRAKLLSIVDNFDDQSVLWLKDKEKVTQHDVKAVEYYLHYAIDKLNIFTDDEFKKIKLAIHYCCTSEDINNLSYALCIKKAVQNVWLPKLEEFIGVLRSLALDNVSTPLLSKTHGQPATPTTLGKELAVFVHRLNRQCELLKQQEYLGKINGATGTFAAHAVANPDIDWPKFAKNFVTNYLDLNYNPLTTQIESHDYQAEVYDRVAHIGRILHNFATDIWTYISNEVFVQIPVEGATGSSTMPHKINPIKFENAEANLEISDAIFAKLSQTLVTSRMQRDLTDSSTQRNISVGFAHSLIALKNLIEGVKKLKVNHTHLEYELVNNQAVLGEAVQSLMRYAGICGIEGMDNPYEKLKELTRGKEITADLITDFISTLNLPDDMKNRLLNLEPKTYIGYAQKLALEALN